MNNNKGFTTMGLVATLVIIAILILIGTPIVSNLIWRVNKSTSEKWTKQYIDDINVVSLKYKEEHDGKTPANYEDIKGNLTSSVNPTYVLTVSFDKETGNVARAIFRMKDKFNCMYENNKISCDQTKELHQIVIDNNMSVLFLDGMTWGQCMKTSYCSTLFNIYGEDNLMRIKFGLFNPEPEKTFVMYNGKPVKTTDKMISNGEYIWGNK